ncbi:hypothetical protein ACHAQA_010019 [Verticillium albo-atrum]
MLDFSGDRPLLLNHSTSGIFTEEPEAHSDASNNTPLSAFIVPSTAPCGSSHEAQQQPLIQHKRRGRPPKVWLTRDKYSGPKTTALKTRSDSYSSILSVDFSLVSPADERPVGSENKASLRARNRAAAHKCRIRKQREMKDLEAQETNLGAMNESLKYQHAKLRDEVLMLKDVVLQHGGCGCSFIESYIQDVAVNVSQKPKAFTTSRQDPASTPILPAANPLRAMAQELSTGGGCLSLLEESDSGEYFDWNMMCLEMDLHFDRGQVQDVDGEIEGDLVG